MAVGGFSLHVFPRAAAGTGRSPPGPRSARGSVYVLSEAELGFAMSSAVVLVLSTPEGYFKDAINPRTASVGLSTGRWPDGCETAAGSSRSRPGTPPTRFSRRAASSSTRSSSIPRTRTPGRGHRAPQPERDRGRWTSPAGRSPGASSTPSSRRRRSARTDTSCWRGTPRRGVVLRDPPPARALHGRAAERRGDAAPPRRAEEPGRPGALRRRGQLAARAPTARALGGARPSGAREPLRPGVGREHGSRDARRRELPVRGRPAADRRRGRAPPRSSPAPADPVRVTAAISDERGIAAVTLFWRTRRGRQDEPDDHGRRRRGGRRVASNGVFGGTIPPAAGSRRSWSSGSAPRRRAADARHGSGRGPDPAFLYQVEVPAPEPVRGRSTGSS